MNIRMQRHPHGVTSVDTEYLYPGHAAAHIIHDGGRAAFVDVGTNYSVPYLLGALEALGIDRGAVDYVFLTHVHLDHAGGAGALMRELPNATAVVHPRGAPHMIDPDKLIAGSKAVYGEERYNELYGELVPIAAARVRLAQDGDRVRLGGRELELIHTPGHALHHYAVVDRAHASIFSGDTFGISYREFDTQRGAFITPTTTPTQFDPDQLTASIDRMMAYAPESIYLMHYSRITGLPRLAASLKSQIAEFVRFTEQRLGFDTTPAAASVAAPTAAASDPYTAIRGDMLALWLRLAREHGVSQTDAQVEALLKNDLDLNTQGLIVWGERRRKAAADSR
ncbi:MAG TPA: MBL fold metallo-hydrolase [Steroidobacteraceae bacterium]|jgi:glyoxylase-like metal-dependent hydrolase (beta-lactamase superfamily II)